MNNRLVWVRLAYWAGIVADIVAALLMLVPRWDGRLFAVEIVCNPIFGLGVRRGAALMVGWAVLLFWADRKPVERKDVLLITVCPVVLGYISYLGYALLAGFTSPRQVIPSLIIEIMFIALFAVGYLNARRLGHG
jgi:hypothetical protein